MLKYLAYLGFGVAVALIIAGSLWCASCRDWFQTKSVETISGSGNWQDKIKVTSLKSGETVTSPLVVTGEARGTWFFEGSFPVTLVDWDGKIIAQAPAMAVGEWMTTNYVPFTVTLNFIKPTYNSKGTLILHNDNPSDRRDLDAALEIPLKFK